MSTKKYEELLNLKSGSYDHYKIKVRVIRLWRGVSSTGEEFKGFNVILLDNKNHTIHAFIPAVCAYQHEKKLKIGKVCIITNFTVQAYKSTDKFRSIRNEKQLIFSKNTKVQDIEDTGSNIQNDWFDLYDHSDLKSLSQQNIYLADVVGIIKEHLPLTNFKNKHGKNQSQAKLTITDGSSNVKVTFWDQFGDHFEKRMLEEMEKPIIIVIASCRVGLWNEEVNLSNVAATKFFLNYHHHSVLHLRKMLTVPGFKEQVFATIERKKAELLTVDDLLKVGKEYVNIEVITHVQVKYVDESLKWYYMACTSCHNQTELENDIFSCIQCNRTVPYPEMKFKICVVASDRSGPIQIILEDREVRTLIGKTALQLFDEQGTQDIFPPQLKEIANKPYTIKLVISEINIVNQMKMYWATNICHGFKLELDEKEQSANNMQQSYNQDNASTSTYHIDGMSGLNFQSQEVQKNKEQEAET